MFDDITLSFNQNKTKAIATFLSFQVSKEDVQAALSMKGIIDGIRWKEIDAAIEVMKKTGRPSPETVVATTADDGTFITIIGNASNNDVTIPFDAFVNDIKTVFETIKNRFEGPQLVKSIFCDRGERIFSLPIEVTLRTVCGEPVTSVIPKNILPLSTTIRMEESNGKYIYTSCAYGYLGIDSRGLLCIVDPLEINEDKSKMWFWILPVQRGKPSLKSKLLELVHAFPLESKNLDIDDHFEDKNISTRLLIRKSITPVIGEDATIRILIETSKGKMTGNDEEISTKDFSPFKMIKEKVVIAEHTPSTKGIPGKNVLGEPISTRDGKELTFAAGKNVEKITENGITRFIAETTGIVNLKNNFVEIIETLIIRGNVAAESGNIFYDKAVIIEGNVTGGFTVDCGGDLAILQSIEEGANVMCKGSLSVTEGILGQKTVVQVGGDAKVGFIQTSNISVKGDLFVTAYIYHSNVFAKGTLTVKGTKLFEENVGAVVGGNLVSMKSMYLHSAGTIASQTAINCGVDMSLYEMLKGLRTLAPVLKQKIAAIQSKIGINLTAANIVKRLQSMPEQQKQIMKKLLLEMKNTVTLLEETEEKRKLLEEKTFSSDDHNASVLIYHKLIPVVKIRIKEAFFPFYKEFYSRKVTIEQGNIVTIPIRTSEK